MAIINKPVDWNEVAERPEGRELLPKGSHNCIFVSNEDRETKTTNPMTGQKGRMIVVTGMIEGGPLSGKTFTEMLNYDCAPKENTQDAIEKAQQAEKIAQKTASNIAKALVFPASTAISICSITSGASSISTRFPERDNTDPTTPSVTARLGAVRCPLVSRRPCRRKRNRLLPIRSHHADKGSGDPWLVARCLRFPPRKLGRRGRG